MKPNQLTVKSEVYDLYWKFAAERQEILFRQCKGWKPPLTEDPILLTYKFCNAYRASDRVSQFLIKHVIYDYPASEINTIFRILLFRLFNKTETWVSLQQELGDINVNNFTVPKYARALEKIKAKNSTIYGNAFILCANKAFGFNQKHLNHLALLEKMFVREDHGRQMLQAKSLEQLFYLLKDLPLLGDFMAYQIAIDCNYSEVYNFDENDFTVAGPGAKRGIQKCFISTGALSDAEIIQFMVKNQDKEFDRLRINFRNLGGRPLKAIDCQGLFCEVDKYTRVKFPHLTSNRSKIKSKYQPSGTKIDYFYPPKWKIKLDEATRQEQLTLIRRFSNQP